MKKLMLALTAVLSLSGIAYSQCNSRTTTCLTNLNVSGATTLEGATTATGVLTTSAATPYSLKIASTTAVVPTGTPTEAGLIAFTNTYVMYVSTGTGVGAWVKVGGQ